MKKRMMTQKEYGRPAMKVVELRHAGMLMAVARRTMAGAMMAATLMLGMTACSSEDGLTEDPQLAHTAQPAQTPQQTYTLTVTASKGDDSALAQAMAKAGLADGATTRALTLSSDGKTLNAAWVAGEKVYVFNDTKNITLGGYLEAKTAGATVTLEGELTGTVEEGDELYLAFPQLNEDYTGQDGTLAKIASTCDYALGEATVTNVSDGKITVEDNNYGGTTIRLDNQQAIVKFTLLNKADNSPINAKSLTIDARKDSKAKLIQTHDYASKEKTYGPITITPSATNVIYAALGTSSVGSYDYTLIATDENGNMYTYTKTGVEFELGEYYEITVKMEMEEGQAINLSTLSGNYVAQNGDVLIGALDGETQPYKISIADGATVTLKDVTINGVNGDDYEWAGITCLGDATIILKDGTTNTVRGFHEDYPGIYVPSGSTLTIDGTGALTAESYVEGKKKHGIGGGIGGGYRLNSGNIVINSGTITATGHGDSAGIGGGYSYDNSLITAGTITINGGTVIATGKGTSGSGIGSGINCSCGNISITGGIVTATGGKMSASIGSGAHATCGDINISGGTVTATGDSDNIVTTGGAGIGTGYDGTCGDISITGGTVTATGGKSAAGIGTGNNGTCGTISINLSSGSVTATGSENAAGIGTSWEGTCGSITVTNGTVTADRGQYADYDIGLGDGGHFSNNSGSVTIGDGVRTSSGKSYSSEDPTEGYNHE